jgi:hypothetical protein
MIYDAVRVEPGALERRTAPVQTSPGVGDGEATLEVRV